MKKIFALILALILCAGMLTGCGGGNKPADSNSKPNIPAKLEESSSTANAPVTTPTNTPAVAVPNVPGSIYSTGTVQALVPEGWAAFPQKDILSDVPGAIDEDVINICKGGQSEDDLLSKPFVRIDYYGPGEEMSGGLKEWYSQTEDLAPLQCGPYTWEGFTTTDYGLMAVLCAEDGEHQYQASIYMEVEGQSISLEDEDVQAILASVSPADSASVGNTGNSGSSAPVTETSGGSDWWAGYWYGWWAIKNGSGIYQDPSDKGIVWDTFAEIQTDGAEHGHITIWDTETSKSFALISGEVTFEPNEKNGVMVLNYGTFFYGNTWLEGWPVAQMELNEEAWRVDPENSTVSHFEDMIEITGHYVSPQNPQDSFDYYIYLRPWGTLWDDVRNGDTSACLYKDMMPLYHDNWYVSLVNLGYEGPTNSFGEGIDIINDYLANQGGSSGSGSALDPAGKAGADGKVDMETLKRCLPFCKTERSYSTTYDEIAAQFGVHGKKIESLFEGKAIYRWLVDDDNYIQITFDIHEDGSETWNVTQLIGID